MHLQPFTKGRCLLLIVVKLAMRKGPNKSVPPLLLPLHLSLISWADWCAHHGCLTIFILHTISDMIDCGKNNTVELCYKQCTC
jgi:hypothetical protein